MSYFVWKPAYSMGVPEIDRQHQRLFDLADRLHAAMSAGKGRQAEQAALSELIRYTVEHFRHEEALMLRAGYPGRVTHRAMHDGFTDAVIAFQSKFEAGGVGLSVQIFQFVRDWLVSHICKEDVKIASAMPAGVH